jgi:hypothetical protein
MTITIELPTDLTSAMQSYIDALPSGVGGTKQFADVPAYVASLLKNAGYGLAANIADVAAMDSQIQTVQTTRNARMSAILDGVKVVSA